jgi:hypothetical protein
VAICLPSLPGSDRESTGVAGTAGSLGAQQAALQQGVTGALLEQQGAGDAASIERGQLGDRQASACGPINRLAESSGINASRVTRGIMPEF